MPSIRSPTSVAHQQLVHTSPPHLGTPPRIAAHDAAQRCCLFRAAPNQAVIAIARGVCGIPGGGWPATLLTAGEAHALSYLRPCLQSP